MVSKQQDVVKCETSPVLFMAVDGKPMSFFLRPGPLKRELQPLIVAGGGVLCRAQQPGAILLIDPAEAKSIPESTPYRYVSTDYILDSINENEQLDIEHYQLHPVTPFVARNTKDGCLGGRVPYTPEEDAAILSYINKHKAQAGGNRIWQEMEKERVTSHSWQSMKYRYKARLEKNQPRVVEMATTEEETEAEVAENEMDAPSTSAEDMQAEPEADQQAADDPEESFEAESSDGEPLPSETAEPEAAVSPQNGPTPGARGRTKQKRKQTPMPPQRRSTRRHPQLQESPSPQWNSRKLRASTPRSSTSKKTQSAARSGPQEEASVEEPPPKKTRGKTVSESPKEQSRPASASGTEATSQPKRTLGILEMAAMEFDCSSDESDADEFDSDNPTEPEIKNPPETAPPLITDDKAASPQSTPEPGLQENPQEKPQDNPQEKPQENPQEKPQENPQEKPQDNPQEKPQEKPQDNPQDNPQEKPQDNPQETQAVSNARQPQEGTAEAVDAPSKAQLFISESQEESSQNTVAAVSLTQDQLEEDKRCMEELMSETQQDLASVTKALLKTSGDFSEARLLLLNSPDSGPLWNTCDDDLLMLGDAGALKQLQERYGKEAVAKRITFLELQV